MRFLLILLLVLPACVCAQSSILEGIVTDDTGEPLIGATVKVFADTGLVRGRITDVEGRFRLPLEPAVYRFEASYTGFATVRLDNVTVVATEKNREIILTLKALSAKSTCCCLCMYKRPLIDPEPGNTGDQFFAEEIRRFY